MTRQLCGHRSRSRQLPSEANQVSTNALNSAGRSWWSQCPEPSHPMECEPSAVKSTDSIPTLRRVSVETQDRARATAPDRACRWTRGRVP